MVPVTPTGSGGMGVVTPTGNTMGVGTPNGSGIGVVTPTGSREPVFLQASTAKTNGTLSSSFTLSENPIANCNM